MVIFDEKIEVDNTKNLNHYENISSTNWNSVRFKVPPSFDGPIGWRVEFRTMEVQLTDDENAAYSILT
jgi:glutamate--cysteine ligase catalytic subunit